MTSSYPQLQLFCVDRKPDPANWTYKSLYRGDIAKYRRKGNSSLGLDPRKQEVSWEESQSKKKKKGTNKKAADRYYSAVNRQMLKSEALVSIFPTNSECSGATGPALFLPLTDDQENTKGPPGGDVQSTAVNPLGVYDSSTTLWLQGKGQQVHAEQENLDMKSEPSATPLTGRTEEFNRQLREQPTDTQLWIKFIKFQDELSTTVFGNEEGEQGITSVDRRKSSYRAVLEKKLSIAERAIATNPCSITLQLERLKICQELLEPSVLAKEWKKLVFLHPNSAPLWREYLLFTQSYFSSFAVSKVNAAYGKCLSTLSAVRDGSMVSHPALPGVEEDMLDIFIQQCHFLRQAGHSEKAISLFQAMMDFTFFKPDSVQKLTTKQQVLRCLCSGNKKRLRSQGKSSKRIAKQLLKESDNRSVAGSVEGLAEAASPASQTLSPVSILKARKLYDQALTARLSALDQTRKKGQEDPPGENIRLRGLAGSYALFQYLTVGIQAANAVYSQARERMEALHHSLISNMQNVSEKDDSLARAADASHSEADSSHTQDSVSRLASDCEALAVQQAALLRYHKSVSVFPLATVREMLTSALSTWPTSAPLWSIYVQVENRYHSAGRARRFFHSITRSNSCMVPRLFAIVAEQQRKQLIDAALGSCGPCVALPTLPENGLSNRIRGLFENIVSKEAGSRCPLVWRMYMHFLVSDGKIEKALGIFYKALQNVPWAKGVYMDGVQLFPGRIQEFVDVMTEKELRLRLPIEELDILLEE
ncbi:hypothetical protein fugu_016753 [Takifugu bimaculatus]|uniref:NRDE-2, necessary for RNA interference, domain containing n=1 Tax=Takifugu bimaculatus TaxID=433685 RepID=A0A4Z2BWE0_9TELE|nr:hypothetical protein fugu_016753 [Takifugu bimaculatus]